MDSRREQTNADLPGKISVYGHRGDYKVEEKEGMDLAIPSF